MPEFDVEQALNVLRLQYAEDYFVAGNCHHLALALYEAAGNSGRLVACIRHHVDAETGQVYMSNYSHMAYQSPEGGIWDIDGLEADERWTRQFDNIDVPDEDNLFSVFEWLTLPAEEVDAFVYKWKGTFRRAIVDVVKAKISAASALAAAS